MSNNTCSWCGRSHSGFTGITSHYNMQSNTYCSQKCKQEHKNSLPSDKTSGGITGEGCFVVTTVYGDYNHPIVLDFRSFRDNFLQKKYFGRLFIKWYYKKGPIFAAKISKSSFLKNIVLHLIVKPLHSIVKFFHLHLS